MHKLFLAFSLTLAIKSFAQETKKTFPFILGQIDSIQSAELNETRRLNIYLPDGYSPDSAMLYPVIYLLDGSANEDFIHISGLVQFANFSWIDMIPKSIVVGISNIDRKRDFTFPTTIAADKKEFPSTGGSEKFIAFIEKELQPYIESHYKTSAAKMIIGQSLGGLLATEILLRKPGLFNQYIIVSPSLWWDNESLLKAESAVPSRDFQQQTSVYVAIGNEEKQMIDDAKKLAVILKKETVKNLQVHFQYFPDEDHATILHEAVYRAFKGMKKNNR